MIPGFSTRRRFRDLTEREVLALAISNETDDSEIYAAFAEHLKEDFPASAKIFEGMAAEEEEHRRRLTDLYHARFGQAILPIRRQDVTGFFSRRPIWMITNLGIERIRKEAEIMEVDARTFYLAAADRCPDPDIRKLLSELAQAETEHVGVAQKLTEDALTPEARSTEDAVAHRRFVLTYVQPGLAGLMDGSVSSLAPVFAAAFATQDSWSTFLVGLAAAVGAGISMGLTEALSDDGVITGRGAPTRRGLACGIMTTVGGLGHALPYLIPSFWTATAIAILVVFLELWAIAWIRWKYMDTPFLRATVQIVLGGALVFAAGILIGNA
ncbi:iron exporter MbfA [Amorphus orientalis]|uniref:Rubrerythrin n=1 Tax=Amorphus orientalis TaxID=649198 RepID=A0AAE4ARJ1_9HYPH|nr:ferritin family protein [Amorphus orientalis]MDQ0314262.1 rubrerythrin [Amorphus orientalis]